MEIRKYESKNYSVSNKFNRACEISKLFGEKEWELGVGRLGRTSQMFITGVGKIPAG
jgi:hypothetical protein